MTLPLAVVMITKNEAHNMQAVMDNLRGFATEIFVVDSFSTDNTVELARSNGAQVVQRGFKDFGDQWNFAVSQLPIRSAWTMKLDPDERIPPALKSQIARALSHGSAGAIQFPRRLWFMGRPLPVHQDVLRIWRTGTCRFTPSKVNEHPIVAGQHTRLTAPLEHHDSPTLHHWMEKQNNYSTAEAQVRFTGTNHTATPRLFGTRLERRMWLKALYPHLPCRHLLMQAYCLFWLGAWRGGKAGWIWARLRADIQRMREFKSLEMAWRKEASKAAKAREGQSQTTASTGATHQEVLG